MLRALIDFTLSNARRFYSSTGNLLDGKGLKQILGNSKKTRQLHSTLNLAIAERKELTVNTRTQDGVKKGTGNISKVIQFHQMNKPCSITWVQFDRADVG